MRSLRSLLNYSSRKFTSSAVRRSGHGHDHSGGIGSNLPFDISNRYKLTLYFMLFFGSGFSAPFLLVRHHLTKNRG